MAKKEGKQVLINNVTKFESEKLLGLVIDGNKRNHLTAQERKEINWYSTRAERD